MQNCSEPRKCSTVLAGYFFRVPLCRIARFGGPLKWEVLGTSEVGGCGGPLDSSWGCKILPIHEEGLQVSVERSKSKSIFDHLQRALRTSVQSSPTESLDRGRDLSTSAFVIFGRSAPVSFFSACGLREDIACLRHFLCEEVSCNFVSNRVGRLSQFTLDALHCNPHTAL